MRKRQRETRARPTLPVGLFARRQIVERLRRAVALAQDSEGAALSVLRELLEDTAGRVAALELTAVREGGGGAAAAPVGAAPLVATRLPGTLLAMAQGEPVDAFLLIPFGEVTVERPVAGGSFRFTRAQAEALCAWFAGLGRKLAIDYEHQSFDRLNTRADGLRPAAGWIGGLEVRDDGLWAVDVVWTERARALLRSGEYRYFSPVIYWADAARTEIAALGPVGLTNDPAMHGVRALAARRSEGAADAAPPAAASEAAIATAGAAPAVVRAADDVASGREAGPTAASEDAAALRRALAASEAEVARLRHGLAEQAAEAFVERGLRLGKIVAATREDWLADYRRDPQMAEARLARAPVVLPPGRVVEPVAAGWEAAETGGPRPWTFEPDDLAAYRRAAAAGRVRAPRA